MTTNIDRAAEIIGQHVKCGWSICERRRRSEDGKLPPLDACGNTNPSCRDVAEGIAWALAADGLLAPDLPEPQTFPNGEREWYTLDGWVNLDTDGTITIVYDERDEDDIAAGAEINPGELVFTRLSEAKVLASAFLAATNHFEKEKNNE